MQILQINPKLKKYTGSNEKSSIEIQLQNAHLEIKMLRDENKVLSIRIAQLEKEQEIFCLMQDELEFRKHQQQKMADLIRHYQEISTKLNEKVNNIPHLEDNQIHKQSAATTIDLHPRDNEEFELEIPSHLNFRASWNKRSKRSDSSDKHNKENHAITPKSRVKIDFCNLFQDKIPIRKKVFL